jgi:ribosomal protein S18 acetylase RimI-like enzyme
MNDMNLVAMVTGEEYQASNVLSVAMVSNPIHDAVLRGHGEVERQRLQDMFLEMLKERPKEVFVMKHESAIVGVLRSQECHEEPMSQERSAVDVDEVTLEDADSRIAHWLRIWDEVDPVEPHRHLGPVGVLPRLQGHGIGSIMMESFCAQVDANGEPAYLETDKQENVRFYEKFRFRLIGETDIFGVKNYFMWRPTT